MVHDVAAVAPVGERLVGLRFLVFAAGEQHRVERQEAREFAHQRVEISLAGGTDGGLDQAVQAAALLLSLPAAAGPGAGFETEPGEPRADDRGGDGEQHRIEHKTCGSVLNYIEYRHKTGELGAIPLQRPGPLPNLCRLADSRSNNRHGQ